MLKKIEVLKEELVGLNNAIEETEESIRKMLSIVDGLLFEYDELDLSFTGREEVIEEASYFVVKIEYGVFIDAFFVSETTEESYPIEVREEQLLVFVEAIVKGLEKKIEKGKKKLRNLKEILKKLEA